MADLGSNPLEGSNFLVKDIALEQQIQLQGGGVFLIEPIQSGALEEVDGVSLNTYSVEQKEPVWDVRSKAFWEAWNRSGMSDTEFSWGMQALCAQWYLSDPGRAHEYLRNLKNNEDRERAQVMLALCTFRQSSNLDAAKQWLPAKESSLYPLSSALLDAQQMVQILSRRLEDASVWAQELWSLVVESLKQSIERLENYIRICLDAGELVNALFYSITDVMGVDFAYDAMSLYLENIPGILRVRFTAQVSLIHAFWEESRDTQSSLMKLEKIKNSCSRGVALDWQNTYAQAVIGDIGRNGGLTLDAAAGHLDKYCLLVRSKAYGALVACAYFSGIMESYDEALSYLTVRDLNESDIDFAGQQLAIAHYVKNRSQIEGISVKLEAYRLYYGDDVFKSTRFDALDKPLAIAWEDDCWLYNKRIAYPAEILRVANMVGFLDETKTFFPLQENARNTGIHKVGQASSN